MARHYIERIGQNQRRTVEKQKMLGYRNVRSCADLSAGRKVPSPTLLAAAARPPLRTLLQPSLYLVSSPRQLYFETAGRGGRPFPAQFFRRQYFFMRSFTLAAVVVGLLALTGCQSRQKNLTVREENVGRQSLCRAAKCLRGALPQIPSLNSLSSTTSSPCLSQASARASS